MEALTNRKISTSREYDYLFPAATNKTKTVLQDATLEDTIAFIHKVVQGTLAQTKELAVTLKGATTYETCSNIWYFVYKNVAYRKDEDGLEQIRSPRRTWRDRKAGVDCDCYSTFISSILTNLHIPHSLRITKYRKNYFQHIYPIVPNGNRFIPIDCVTDRFNYEVPFSEKKDIQMDLQYLDGLQGIRGDDLVFEGYEDGIGELGAAKKKKKGFFKKVLSKINKINPATVLLRNGVLAAMKLNLFKVASRLKYSYLSPEDAAKRGILPEKYQKLLKVREKLDNIFETGGGNPKNLRKAILKGKGNKDKSVAVAGLGFLPEDNDVAYMNINTPLAQLLGTDIYHSENVEGMEGFAGFGALGEPATAASVAAATGIIAAIAKALKSVGDIFGGKKGQGSADFDEKEVTAAEAKDAAALPAANTGATSGESPASQPADDSASTGAENASITPAAASVAQTAVSDTTSLVASSSASDTPPTTETFWSKNKKWLLPAAIGIGGITVIAVMMNGGHKGHAVNGLNGTPKRKKNQGRKKKNKHSKKQSVALL